MGFLMRAGIKEETAAQRAAETRSRQEYMAILALELGVLGASAGLREHMADIWRGKKTIEAARDGYKSSIVPIHERRRSAWKQWQGVVDEVRKESPAISSAQLWRVASRRLKNDGEVECSPRSVRRRCTDPAPPHPHEKN